MPREIETLLLTKANDLLAAARRVGADAADVLAVQSLSQSVSVRLGKVEDIERSESRDLGLRVFIGKRQAFISSTDLDAKTFPTLAERAVAMAKLAPEDPYCGLAEPDQLAKSWPDLDLEDSHEPSSEALKARALAAEDAGRAVPGISNSEGAGGSSGRGTVALVTSAGFAGAYGSSSFSISCSVVAGEGTGMERDYDYDSARFESDLRAPEDIGREAAERALKRLNPRKIKSATLPVVYDPRVSAGLVGHFAGAVNGAAIARGVSFLKDKMNQPVFATGIRIIDDPHRIRGQRSKPFDGEGLPTRRYTLIEDGRLTTWLLDTASGRKLGLAPTGHAARGTGGPPSPSTSNLYLEPGPLSPAELMADIREGLYVTELIGMGVNGVTGDYSRGAAGFWIENGQLAYPVSEITVAGNLKDMFLKLTPANDLKFRYGTNAPTLRIDGMTIAGT